MGHMTEISTLILVSPGGVVTIKLHTIYRRVRDIEEDVGDLHPASGSWRSRAFFYLSAFLGLSHLFSELAAFVLKGFVAKVY